MKRLGIRLESLARTPASFWMAVPVVARLAMLVSALAIPLRVLAICGASSSSIGRYGVPGHPLVVVAFAVVVCAFLNRLAGRIRRGRASVHGEGTRALHA